MNITKVYIAGEVVQLEVIGKCQHCGIDITKERYEWDTFLNFNIFRKVWRIPFTTKRQSQITTCHYGECTEPLVSRNSHLDIIPLPEKP